MIRSVAFEDSLAKQSPAEVGVCRDYLLQISWRVKHARGRGRLVPPQSTRVLVVMEM